MCRLSWFLDPGGWSKTAAVGLYFIFPGICTLSLGVELFERIRRCGFVGIGAGKVTQECFAQLTCLLLLIRFDLAYCIGRETYYQVLILLLSRKSKFLKQKTTRNNLKGFDLKLKAKYRRCAVVTFSTTKEEYLRVMWLAPPTTKEEHLRVMADTQAVLTQRSNWRKRWIQNVKEVDITSTQK
ncbi:hypothetical protein STEG23_007762, partial [Scotinomys teguina]